jgi:basic amino acid/polyamine antiporter, APA family
MSNLFRKKNINDILASISNSKNDEGSLDGHGHESLGRHLRVRDLAAFGIAAIIGAGIFSTIGTASADGGPAVIFLFIFTALACGFAAFAYAEFASMVPVAGSAYTYSYVAFGEIIAWIIGWSLIMEYAIGNVTVAISWSDYFTGMLHGIGIDLPGWIQTDYMTASNGYHEAELLMNGGKLFENLSPGLQAAHTAWENAPTIGGFHLIFDLPALLIIVLITWLVYRGMKESRNASNLMVVIKLAIILLVIAVGIFYVDTSNWSPFAPNGVSGILKGVSAVFFAYIGFDAISTTAEECENPQRDLPRGMMWAIIICTILYVIIALILTGMVSYNELAVGDPLAYVFEKLDLKWMSGIIAVSAVVAMASVLLVFQMGQPRIWMSMSRDGLLPPKFAKVHPRFKTPSFSTVVVGFVVAIPVLFLNLSTVTDLCSIGTLFAFVLVCGGVLVLQNKKDIPRGKFKTPYVNGKYVLPILVVGAGILLFTKDYKAGTMAFLKNEKQLKSVEEVLGELSPKQTLALKTTVDTKDPEGFKKAENDVENYYSSEDKSEQFYADVQELGRTEKSLYSSGFGLFAHKIPMWIFILFTIGITIVTIMKNLSLIPLLGLLSCLYMMAQLKLDNWIWFTVWLIVGLIIYFGYSRKHSKLNTK